MKTSTFLKIVLIVVIIAIGVICIISMLCGNSFIKAIWDGIRWVGIVFIFLGFLRALAWFGGPDTYDSDII